jgi:hypothetical protein
LSTGANIYLSSGGFAVLLELEIMQGVLEHLPDH